MSYEGVLIAERFEIVSLAGKGGMGSIYRARDRATGGTAALKILHDHEPSDRSERFAREARLLAELVYPSVVRYFAHGFTDRGEPFLAMEWLDGEDLSTRLRRAGVTTAEAVQLVRRVAEALGAAHARGVVHRDVKPSNLFLVNGELDRVKVLDFGIARLQAAADAMTRTGAAVGTPGYMAPEQARGSRDVDARADVFSLGCVLFECLAGCPPFVGDTPIAVLAKILLEDAPRISVYRDDLPADLTDALAHMLAKDPAERFRDGAAVVAALDALAPIADPAARPQPRRGAAVTHGEQRLVCVVFARHALDPTDATASDPTPGDPTLAGVGHASVATALTLAASGTGALPALSAAVTAHGGRAELLADGSIVIMLFGQGTATDQAARAARCALAVRAIVPDAAMALAIGRCLAGVPSPLGDLIDRAAGLLQARPGRAESPPIWVDEVAAGLLDVRFAIDGVGDGLVLRGERDVADPARTLLGRPTPCVGRERELAMLDGIFEQCIAEPIAQIVVVTAAAGVGKSRLRHEFLRRLAQRPATSVEVWIGRADPMSAGAPFAMLAQALRRTAGIVDSEPISVRHRKLRARACRNVAADDAPRVSEFLGELIGAPVPGEPSVPLRAARCDPQLMGDQMLRACEDFVAAECAVNPVLVVLEDLHWGDLPTIRFVDAIVRQLPDRPLMVLALARPEVDASFPRLWSERRVERIHLAELTRRAAEKLVLDALGTLDPAVVSNLVDRAAGNPFYLEESIRAFARAALAAPPDRTTGSALAVTPDRVGAHADHLPETVVAMVQARIEGLEPEARHVLRAASIFGQVFWRGGVAALLEGGTTQVADWLDELVRRELVIARREQRFVGEAEYTFRHALVRDAAYAMLPDRDRALGHRLAGDWLESHVRTSDRVAEVEAVTLAEHFERSGDPRRSVAWYRQAAEQALEGHDLGAAIDRAERAIACVRSVRTTPEHTAVELAASDRELVGSLRQLESDAHGWRGEYARAVDRGTEALELLPPTSAAWLAAAAAVADGCLHQLEYAKVLELCRTLVDTVASPATRRAYAYAVAMTMPALLWHGDHALIGRVFARLDEIEAGALDDPATLAWIFCARSWRALRDGDLAACLALDTRIVECFTAVGDMRHACQQRAYVGYDELMLGAASRAESSLRAAIAIAERIGLHQVTTQAQHNLGFALARQGRLDEARAVEAQALVALEAQGNRRLATAARDYLSMIEIAAGNLPLAIEHAQAAIAAAPDLPALQCSFYGTLSTARRLAGDVEGALAAATTAIRLIEAHGRPEENESAVRLAYAEALFATGAVAEARAAIVAAEACVIEMASKIRDPEWRRSFLESIAENARIAALARDWAC